MLRTSIETREPVAAFGLSVATTSMHTVAATSVQKSLAFLQSNRLGR